jgi:hypothetical protein
MMLLRCALPNFYAAGISLLQRNISGDALHNSEQRFPPPQCHPNTRIAVQTTIQRWAADTDSQAPSVMWLYVLYATAYPAELGIRPLGYYKPTQYKILGSSTCTMLDDL